MTQKNSLFVIIPALNEEKNIAPTVEMVRAAVKNYFQEVQICIFNDGSRDRTGEVADGLAKKYPEVRVVHHEKPKGLGYAYKAGIRMSPCEYVIMVPGDNEGLQKSFESIFSLAGQKDIVIPYCSNTEVRPFLRRVISKLFVHILNVLFLMRLKYFNGCVLHKTEIIQSIEIETDSFAYQAEALIKLIKRGHTYVEVGTDIQERPSGSSKAFTLKNITTVTTSILDLIRGVYFSDRPKNESYVER